MTEKIKNNIELVSLHIPKTCGTSFRNTLKTVYGNKSVKRLDINSKCLKIDQKVYEKSSLLSNIRIIHGHFKFNSVFEKIELSETTPVITWLRDPVERVISNYFYLKKIIQKKIRTSDDDGNLGDRMLKSLTEYARAEENRNRISKFLSGAKLEDFFFIGIVENYENDLATLSELLNWEKYSIFKDNQTSKETPVVSEEDRKLIKSINENDVELYNTAIEIKALKK